MEAVVLMDKLNWICGGLDRLVKVVFKLEFIVCPTQCPDRRSERLSHLEFEQFIELRDFVIDQFFIATKLDYLFTPAHSIRSEILLLMLLLSYP